MVECHLIDAAGKRATELATRQGITPDDKAESGEIVIRCGLGLGFKFAV